MIGKFGRKPPSGAPALMFSDFLRVAPPHPVAQDNLARQRSWRMLGNNEYGDCVSVAVANQIRTVTQDLGLKKVYPTLTQVLNFYRTQNPNFPAQDDGMVVQDALSYLLHTGWPGRSRRRCLAYAKVRVSHEDELDAAIAIFGSLVLGIWVQPGNEADFDAGRVWSDHGEQPLGGHAVVAAGYKAGVSLRFVTWAQETMMGLDYVRGCVEEAWVVIWPENLGSEQFYADIDVPGLQAAYKSLTGRVLPLPDGV